MQLLSETLVPILTVILTHDNITDLTVFSSLSDLIYLCWQKREHCIKIHANYNYTYIFYLDDKSPLIIKIAAWKSWWMPIVDIIPPICCFSKCTNDRQTNSLYMYINMYFFKTWKMMVNLKAFHKTNAFWYY